MTSQMTQPPECPVCHSDRTFCSQPKVNPTWRRCDDCGATWNENARREPKRRPAGEFVRVPNEPEEQRAVQWAAFRDAIGELLVSTEAGEQWLRAHGYVKHRTYAPEQAATQGDRQAEYEKHVELERQAHDKE